jgi:hypothetical protein
MKKWRKMGFFREKMGFRDFREKMEKWGNMVANGRPVEALQPCGDGGGGGGKVFGWWDLDIREIGRRENTEEGGGAVCRGKKMGEKGKKVT